MTLRAVRGGTGSGSGDASTSDPLSQFAATTSAQLRGVISDEQGDGPLLFAGLPVTLSANTNLTKTTHGSGRVITIDTASTMTIQDDTAGGTASGDSFYGIFTGTSGTVVFQNESTGTASVVTAGAGKSLTGYPGQEFSFTHTPTAHTWVGGFDAPDVLVFAVGDETTAITTGTAKVSFRFPYVGRLVGVRASLTTASSSGTPTVDINEAGTTMLSTKLTIDANELTSTTAASAAVISDASFADDALGTIDIDTAGTGAAGLKVALYMVRAS